MISEQINKVIAALQAAKCCNCESLRNDVSLLEKKISKIEDDTLSFDFHAQDVNNLSIRVSHLENIIFEQSTESGKAKLKRVLNIVFNKSTFMLFWLCALTSMFAAGIVFLVQGLL